MVRSRLAVSFLVIFASSAAAQEEGTVPGAIPDPGSYQGSMVLQQQSDAQDQQFREQQQQQQQYQPPQSYSSGGSNQGYSSPVSRSAQHSAVHAVPQQPVSPLMAAYRRGDYPTVLKMLKPRAMAGDPSAESNLGYMYEKGYGLPRNPGIAASWYRKSADQGHAPAQLALGRLYYEGLGLQRDLVEAYKWMYLAGRSTSRAFPYIRLIGNMLTYDEMSEALRRGQMWTPVGRH